jgi:hypothetical protein
MKGLREQLDALRQRAEKAEAERDADRKSLAEMVIQIRQRDEAERLAAEERARSPPKKTRSRPSSSGKGSESGETAPLSNGAALASPAQADGVGEGQTEVPALSRTNTITPESRQLTKPPNDQQALIQSLPYASVIGVVLLGMGLMAYINGWQSQARLDR